MRLRQTWYILAILLLTLTFQACVGSKSSHLNGFGADSSKSGGGDGVIFEGEDQILLLSLYCEPKGDENKLSLTAEIYYFDSNPEELLGKATLVIGNEPEEHSMDRVVYEEDPLDPHYELHSESLTLIKIGDFLASLDLNTGEEYLNAELVCVPQG